MTINVTCALAIITLYIKRDHLLGTYKTLLGTILVALGAMLRYGTAMFPPALFTIRRLRIAN